MRRLFYSWNLQGLFNGLNDVTTLNHLKHNFGIPTLQHCYGISSHFKVNTFWMKKHTKHMMLEAFFNDSALQQGGGGEMFRWCRRHRSSRAFLTPVKLSEEMLLWCCFSAAIRTGVCSVRNNGTQMNQSRYISFTHNAFSAFLFKETCTLNVVKKP